MGRHWSAYRLKLLAALTTEVLIFAVCTGGVIGGVVQAEARCWGGPGPSPQVVNRYIVQSGKRTDILGSAVYPAQSGQATLGLDLSLRRSCYCPDGQITADLHTFQPGDALPWVEVQLGSKTGQQLSETQSPHVGIVSAVLGDRTPLTLEGEWIDLPHGRYRVEMNVMCSTRAGSLPIEFATFIK